MSIDTDEYKLAAEEKLHKLTKIENDQRLANQLQEIQIASKPELLEPFAKAYLGLYLEIDASFSPEQRIKFIAGENLYRSVMLGLHSVLNNIEFLPSITEIGRSMASDKRMELGYVLLVSMDLYLKDQEDINKAILNIKPEMLSAVLCFHFANSSGFKNKWWFDVVSLQPKLVAKTLQAFWIPLMDKGVRLLPGLKELLKTQQGQQLIGEIILPILSGWAGYKKKSLNILLAIALRYAEPNKFLPIVENILQTDNKLNPRMRMVWLTCAFIIKPEAYWQQMQDYSYRSKEKLLPLLDFSIALLDEIHIEVNILSKIIRLVAPKFPPHIDDFGALAANPQKTLRLFYEMANREESIVLELAWLRSARVMKIVSPILDEVEALNQKNRQLEPMPDFPCFMADLLNSGTLKEKRSRFKNKL